MTNFIFKSSTTLKKLANQLELILREQRAQRSDLALIIRELVKVTNQFNLEKQVSDYYLDKNISDQES